MRFLMRALMVRSARGLIDAFWQNLSERARVRCCLDVACHIRVGSSGLVGERPTELVDLLVTAQSCFSKLLLRQYTPPSLFCRAFRPIAHGTLPMR